MTVRNYCAHEDTFGENATAVHNTDYYGKGDREFDYSLERIFSKDKIFTKIKLNFIKTKQSIQNTIQQIFHSQEK